MIAAWYSYTVDYRDVIFHVADPIYSNSPVCIVSSVEVVHLHSVTMQVCVYTHETLQPVVSMYIYSSVVYTHETCETLQYSMWPKICNSKPGLNPSSGYGGCLKAECEGGGPTSEGIPPIHRQP